MVRGHDLFQALTVEQANRISGFSLVRKYDADQSIFKIDTPGTHVYMLLKGAVYLRLPAEPRDFNIVVSKIETGELFGLSPLLDSPVYTATAVSAEYTEVLAIEAKPFRELLVASHPVGFNIMSRVARIYFTRYINVLKDLQGVVSQIALIR
jgi:signal-transduction protein with cAMP-binding, CBS, and nucleotidyltransferase domain